MYKEFWFDHNQDKIRSDQLSKFSEVATYLQQNPSVRVGIDSFQDPYTTDSYTLGLGQRRVDAVRDALISAGLPADRIQQGGINRTRFQCVRDYPGQNYDECRRVAVMINSGN